MRILFASPERDLLECFKSLFDPDLGETVTAFDGTQVLYIIANEQFDAVIIDSALPRIGYREITEKANAKNTPIIVLTYGPVNPHMLSEENLPNDYLSFPFNSEMIFGAVKNVLAKKSSGEVIRVGDAEIDVSGFCIKNGPRVTATETDVFRAVVEGKAFPVDGRACVSSLNAKFAQAGLKTRIKYMTGKGFETVTENE